MHSKPAHTALPLVAGIGLRSPHMRDMLEQRPAAGWLEIHAENYMDDGGASGQLERLRESYALSVHGVGLSLGSAEGIDRAHLHRLKAVCDRFQPAMVSEHLSWCIGDGVYLNDLLPVPRDAEALAIVADNIALTQDVLKRPILIENVTAYAGFGRSTMSEPDFLRELVARTGCGLLLDINNVYVSAHNIGFDAESYISGLPGEAIGEIHLGGHVRKLTDDGDVLIDDHASAVAADVWLLYAKALKRFGRRPTLIEWDSGIPPLETLLGEAMWADLLAESLIFHATERTTLEETHV
jgi:uncharacterized protein